MEPVLERIRAIVGDQGLLRGDDVSARAVNWLGLGSRAAKAIVRPANTDELSKIMKICHDMGQSLVPIGGLSGLVDGTHSTKNDLVLSCERMNKIEEIDITGGTMTVQAGAILQQVQEAAHDAEMDFAVDIGARGSAQIGGLIATNAGGNQVIRYGMMREQVLGLEVVLADGRVISSMNKMLKNNAGYDLKQLFIGSEGTLGIISRAVLRLRPQMQSTNTVLVALDDFSKIPKLLKHFQSAMGGTLNAFEVMWQNYYQLVLNTNADHNAPLVVTYRYYILIEAAGGDQDTDAKRFLQILEGALAQELIKDAALAQSGEQRNAMWAIREDITALVMGLLPAAAFDVSLPILDMQNYVDQVELAMNKKWDGRAKLAVFGHLGDGNIHLAIGTGTEGELDAREAEEAVYTPLRAFGGSVSAEHGIGLEKREWLAHCRTDAELKLMRQMKQALDPNNILNPGKVLG